jgi:Methylamine utilisation protein MauE
MSWPFLSGVCRLLLGLILLASALGKSLDIPGFVDVLITYREFPDGALWPVALLITGIEWVLGGWILSGWRLATGALAALVLYAVYALWMTLSLVRGLDLPNCGCYGVFFPRPLSWHSPFEDLVLLGMCYALRQAAKKSCPSVDRRV